VRRQAGAGERGSTYRIAIFDAARAEAALARTADDPSSRSPCPPVFPGCRFHGAAVIPGGNSRRGGRGGGETSRMAAGIYLNVRVSCYSRITPRQE
jgi:hypothetical protein